MNNNYCCIPLLFAVLLSLFAGCQSEQKQDDGLISLNEIKDLKTRQYAVEGQVLYENNCANCHQKNGTGLGKLIPPLVKADFMLEDTGRTIHLMKHGIAGEITVNGIVYNQPMPGNARLTNLELAEIATYIYSVFGGKEQRIEVDQVRSHLND